MSDNKKIPVPPPPDDHLRTSPNIGTPSGEDYSSDWDKTNYKMPKQPPPADEWGRTVANIKPIDTGGQDHDKTFFPGAQKPSVPEWGMTEARSDLANADFGRDAAPDEGYGKTTPYFTLPEAERAKYQNLPPTPTEQAAQAAQAKQGGVPGWLWASLGLFAVLFFATAIAAIIYYFIIGNRGFEVMVQNAPAGAEFRVDGSTAGVTTGDDLNSVRLTNLKVGDRKISIIHPNYSCEDHIIKGSNGEKLVWIVTQCKAKVAKPTDDCVNFHPGEFDKAELCYNKALDELPDPFTADQLVKALNILIINFESGSYAIPQARLAALQKGAGFIKKLQQLEPNTVLQVGGHTDSDGSDASNQTLSENRANAVKDVLVKFGVNPSGLQTRGYGETQPKFDNNTEQGKFLNRRIEYSPVRRP